ncbi:MAG: hypothetical protein IKU37_09305 [Candidatus Gastranaerophilales bacterium]|nr:hypothetical protein [Candidatus Gastranaerophilales bacterium]
MKKRLLLLTFALAVTSAMPVFAMPYQMPDGNVFDVEYYRKNNPDVVAALGDDGNVLYSHYTSFGKNEGRKPCEDGAIPVIPSYIYDPSDDCNGQWTKKRTWTASNGVILKIKDEYARFDFENDVTLRAAFYADDVIICNGQDLSPNSDFMRALNEFQYGTPDRWVTDMSSLPLVDTPATKQTSAPETDSWKAYKAAFDPLWCMQVEGSTYGVAKIQNYGTGIGLFGGVIGGYVWNLDWIGDCWQLKIMVNPHDLSWNAIRNSLRLVSPDGEQLYEEIYRQAYEDNPTFTAFNTWCPIGGSEAMILSPEDTNYFTVCFR